MTLEQFLEQAPRSQNLVRITRLLASTWTMTVRSVAAGGLVLVGMAAATAGNMTPNAVDEGWYDVNFPGGVFSGTPVVVATMQTANGSDPASLRMRNITAGGFDVVVQEEQSADTETGHANEVVGYGTFTIGPITNNSGNVIGEAGRLSRNQGDPDQWRTVTLARTYGDPVVVMNLTTFNGADPAHVRIRNVTRTSFQWQIEEWDYQNGSKPVETIDYVVVDSGRHVLPDGKVMEVGIVDVDDDWTRVDFFAGFGSTPLVLTQSQTYIGAEAIVTRQRRATSGGFDVRVQEEEANNGSHASEEVGYIAVTTGFPTGGNGGTLQSDALFASGFESGVSVVPRINRHELSGTDSVTGDDWSDLVLFDSHKFHYSITHDTPDRWVTSEIVSMPGPDGSTTRALHMAVLGDAPESALTRNELQFVPPANFTRAYVRYWLRFESDVLDAMPPNDDKNWRMFMEMKEIDSGITHSSSRCGSAAAGGSNNWRLNVVINRNSKTGRPQWRLKTEQVQPCRESEVVMENDDIPIPAGEWFLVETFYRRGDASSGRFWMAINGEELFDFRGRTQHANNPRPLQFWSVVKLYQDLDWLRNGRTRQWVDDLAIYRDIP